MDQEYASTVIKYLHYFHQQTMYILWHKQALAHTHLGTRTLDVISILLGPISTSHFTTSHANLHLYALNGGQIALNLGSTYIPTPFDECFFIYRRRVYADRFFSYIQCCHDSDIAEEQCYSDSEEGWPMNNFSSKKAMLYELNIGGGCKDLL